MYELGMWDWEYEIDLQEGLVNTYSDEGKTNAKHKPDNCKVTGKLVNTDCLFAAPKNGLDLEGDNKQRDNSEEVQLFGITRQRWDYGRDARYTGGNMRRPILPTNSHTTHKINTYWTNVLIIHC